MEIILKLAIPATQTLIYETWTRTHLKLTGLTLIEHSNVSEQSIESTESGSDTSDNQEVDDVSTSNQKTSKRSNVSTKDVAVRKTQHKITKKESKKQVALYEPKLKVKKEKRRGRRLLPVDLSLGFIENIKTKVMRAKAKNQSMKKSKLIVYINQFVNDYYQVNELASKENDLLKDAVIEDGDVIFEEKGLNTILRILRMMLDGKLWFDSDDFMLFLRNVDPDPGPIQYENESDSELSEQDDNSELDESESEHDSENDDDPYMESENSRNRRIMG